LSTIAKYAFFRAAAELEHESIEPVTVARAFSALSYDSHRMRIECATISMRRKARTHVSRRPARGARVPLPNAARRERQLMTDALSALVEDGEGLLHDGDYAGARRIFEEAVAQAEAEHGVRAKEMIVPLMGLARMG
jgi:hypothetical protein